MNSKYGIFAGTPLETNAFFFNVFYGGVKYKNHLGPLAVW